MENLTTRPYPECYSHLAGVEGGVVTAAAAVVGMGMGEIGGGEAAVAAVSTIGAADVYRKAVKAVLDDRWRGAVLMTGLAILLLGVALGVWLGLWLGEKRRELRGRPWKHGLMEELKLGFLKAVLLLRNGNVGGGKSPLVFVQPDCREAYNDWRTTGEGGEDSQEEERFEYPHGTKQSRPHTLVHRAKGMHSVVGEGDRGQEGQLGEGGETEEERKGRLEVARVREGKVPRHIAVIMDGNRRYGVSEHGDALKGHSAGGKTLGSFVEWCLELGVDVLSVYAFSTENWSRDPAEVDMLMEVLCKHCSEYKEEARERNVRIRVAVSDYQRLPAKVMKACEAAQEATRHCTGILLNICLSYGARQEIAGACQAICEQVQQGSLAVSSIDSEVLARHLLSAALPDPDLLIRTSGETRLSNFLLYQMAYTELFFEPKLWPELTKLDLCRIITEYQGRHRRFGR